MTVILIKFVKSFGKLQYWLLVTAVYLGWSFFTDGWRMTWIIWPVAGVLFAAVKNACMAVIEKRNSRIK